MRNIINVIITFALFWLGSTYFPESAHIVDTKTLILATILMFVIGYIFSWLFFVSCLLIPLGIGCLTTIVLFLAAIIITPIKLWILTHYLPGFEVHGFWTYVVFTVALSLFTIKRPETKKSN